MPFKLLLLICVLTSAACREVSPTLTPTPSPAPTPTEVEQTDDYIETLVNDVRLGMEIPMGWKAHKTQGGLLMTEHYTSTDMMMGLLVHVFVYSMSEFDIPTSSNINVALSILNQIILLPKFVQGGTASNPQGFDWDSHDAAYYLLNNGDDSVTMLVAVAIETPQRLVVCNISSPTRYSQSIRVMLPNLLGSLTINGITMDLTAVNELPNPLVFPVYQPRPGATVEGTWGR